MKNRMPKRKTIKKISAFLASFKRKKRGVSSTRTNKRNHLSSKAPSSTKFSKFSLSRVYRTNKYQKNTSRKGIILDTLLKKD